MILWNLQNLQIYTLIKELQPKKGKTNKSFKDVYGTVLEGNNLVLEVRKLFGSHNLVEIERKRKSYSGKKGGDTSAKILWRGRMQGGKKQTSIVCGRKQIQDEAGKDSNVENFHQHLKSNGKPLKCFKDLAAMEDKSRPWIPVKGHCSSLGRRC